MPWLRRFNGEALADQEAEAAGDVFGAVDAELVQGLAMPGQAAALAAAGLPPPPPPQLCAPAAPVWLAGADAAGAPEGASDGGAQASQVAAWLAELLPHLSGGAALAAVGADSAGRAAACGRAFVERLASEAVAVHAGLARLDELWGPALIEPCAEEGWLGHHTLPTAFDKT
jgi:hypothetical protein